MSEAVKKNNRSAVAVAPRLFVLELNAGRIHSMNTDGTDRKTIVSDSDADQLEAAVKDWLAQPGPALLHVHVNPMQLVMPPFMQVEPAIGMALYSTRAILHGRGGDVWEMVKENFL
jgi:hypothetical protein